VGKDVGQGEAAFGEEDGYDGLGRLAVEEELFYVESLQVGDLIV
jgi:hypothetical protein